MRTALYVIAYLIPGFAAGCFAAYHVARKGGKITMDGVCGVCVFWPLALPYMVLDHLSDRTYALGHKRRKDAQDAAEERARTEADIDAIIKEQRL